VDEIPVDRIQDEEHPLPLTRRLRDRSTLKQLDRYEANVIEVIVPTTYQEAVTSSDASMWLNPFVKKLSDIKSAFRR